MVMKVDWNNQTRIESEFEVEMWKQKDVSMTLIA